MELNEIINRITYFRNLKGLSARELSLMIGKGKNYINGLEAKPFNLPISVFEDIISALEVSESEFFAPNYRTYDRDNELYQLITSLSKDRKDNLIQFIKKS